MVLIKSSLDKLSNEDKFLKVLLISSQNVKGSLLDFSAALCIFWPCSSVPVKKKTLKPSILLNLANMSAIILE